MDRIRGLRHRARRRLHPSRVLADPSARAPARPEQGHHGPLQGRARRPGAGAQPGDKVDDDERVHPRHARPARTTSSTRSRSSSRPATARLASMSSRRSCSPSGEAVLVDRGWQETENTVARPDVPAPPTGEVTITGWLRQNNGAGGDAIRPIEGQIRAISSVGFAKSVPYDLLRRLPQPAHRRTRRRPRSSRPSRSPSSARVRTSSTPCSGGSSPCSRSSATSGSPGPRPRSAATRPASTGSRDSSPPAMSHPSPS